MATDKEKVRKINLVRKEQHALSPDSSHLKHFEHMAATNATH